MSTFEQRRRDREVEERLVQDQMRHGIREGEARKAARQSMHEMDQRLRKQGKR